MGTNRVPGSFSFFFVRHGRSIAPRTRPKTFPTGSRASHASRDVLNSENDANSSNTYTSYIRCSIDTLLGRTAESAEKRTSHHQKPSQVVKGCNSGRQVRVETFSLPAGGLENNVHAHKQHST